MAAAFCCFQSVGVVVTPSPRFSNSPRFFSGSNRDELLTNKILTFTSPSPATSSSSLCRYRYQGAEIMSSGYGTSDGNELVVCFGEMLIDLVPTAPGVSLEDAPEFNKAPGGALANVAVGITRLGGSSAFIGKVGEDEFGYMLANILKQNNVNTDGLRFDPHARTALSFATLGADGMPEFMFYRNPSADMLLEESELDYDIIKKAKIFHYGSTSLITEPCRSALIAATKAAKKAGVLLSFDANLKLLPLWPSAESAREEILSICETADVIKMNKEELYFLLHGQDKSEDFLKYPLGQHFFHKNLKLLLVTEGSNGCRYFTQRFSGKVGGLRVIDGAEVEVVDTTGAGDAFVAGLLSQIAANPMLLKNEFRMRDALKLASACATLTIMKRGAIPALPTKEVVKKTLRNPLSIFKRD